MYQFNRKETEDMFISWIKNEELSHHELDDERFYKFVRCLCVNEEKLDNETFHELIKGQTNIYGHTFSADDVSEFVDRYDDLLNFFIPLRKRELAEEVSENRNNPETIEQAEVRPKTAAIDEKLAAIDLRLADLQEKVDEFTYKDCK
ncbi:MAG: hypothetical protein LBL58_09635 [Tannerellaceae bacterium]|jgi:hypothetical protein|nr:hypothetical protein [Tannerellaceae bacterium]